MRTVDADGGRAGGEGALRSHQRKGSNSSTSSDTVFEESYQGIVYYRRFNSIQSNAIKRTVIMQCLLKINCSIIVYMYYIVLLGILLSN